MKKTILRRALHLARTKNHCHPRDNGFRHFSFVVQNNKILEMGVNRVAEPLLYLGYSKFSGRHAEHDVLIKAKGIMDHSKPFEIINIRLNKRGEIRLSKPCKVCYSWLTTMNCKSIFYSTNEGFETITI